MGKYICSCRQILFSAFIPASMGKHRSLFSKGFQIFNKCKRNNHNEIWLSQAWWDIPVTPAWEGWLRKEELKIEVSLSCTVTPYFKNKF